MTPKTKAQIVVQIKNLVKIFSDEKEREHCVLPGISLNVFEGTFLTIVGPSGSGKTTLLDSIRDAKVVDGDCDGLFDDVEVNFIQEDTLGELDPGLLSFFNVNTQEDLDRAQALVAEGR